MQFSLNIEMYIFVFQPMQYYSLSKILFKHIIHFLQHDERLLSRKASIDYSLHTFLHI